MIKIFSCALIGVQISEVEIQIAVGKGFAGLIVLGISNECARDIKEKVRSALETLGVDIPSKRIVVSVSCSGSLKNSRIPPSFLEFPIATGVMLATHQNKKPSDSNKKNVINADHVATPEYFIFGELELNGAIKNYDLDVLILTYMQKFVSQKIFCIPQNKESISTNFNASSNEVHRFSQLRDVQEFTSKRKFQKIDSISTISNAGEKSKSKPKPQSLDRWINLFEIFSQHQKLLLAILLAAVGRHHILLCGSPGIGKSFGIRHLQDLLPGLSCQESNLLQIITEGRLTGPILRPFRNPHHSCSAAALLGGSNLKPGELTLAHRGILFLDEFAEFPRSVLECLRESMESRKIELAKANGSVTYPADFQLCAATNPCPCGYFFSTKTACRCNPSQIKRYQSKFSGPLLDRFCVHIVLDEIVSTLQSEKTESNSIFLKELQNELTTKPEQFAQRIIATQLNFYSQNDIELEQIVTSLKDNFESFAISKSLSQRGKQKSVALGSTLSKMFPTLPVNEIFWQSVLALRQLDACLNMF